MHAEHQHRRREHDHVIDTHRVHGALHQCDLGVGSAARHGFAKALLVRDAAEHVLLQHARRCIEKAGRRTAAVLKGARHLLVDVAVHAVDDFRPECRLGNVGIDIDDEIIVEPGFLGGVGKDIAGVGLDSDFRQFTDARIFFPFLPVRGAGFGMVSSDHGSGALSQPQSVIVNVSAFAGDGHAQRIGETRRHFRAGRN